MTTRYLLLTLIPAALLALLISQLSTLSLLVSWLIAISIVAFLTYGFDKFIAGSRFTRVPEDVLLVLAAAGGVVGAGLGMLIFRHKTQKRPFLTRFAIAALVAVIIFGSLLFWQLFR